VNISRSHFSLNRGLLLSLVIHALPFALVVALSHVRFTVPQRAGERLQVELFGMVTGQQVAGQQAMAAIEAQKGEAAPEEEKAPEEPPHPVEQKREPNAVVIRKKKKSPASPHEHHVAGHVGQEAVAGRVQQTIGGGNSETSMKRQYLATLSRIMRDRLVYPLKARAKGLTGVTRVAFTVSEAGNIVPGSASVLQTSGYAELDQAALNAVRGNMQLPQPPHQMQVEISFDFLQKS